MISIFNSFWRKIVAFAITINYEIEEAKINPILKKRCCNCNKKIYIRKKDTVGYGLFLCNENCANQYNQKINPQILN
jgi:hypothetical protein